MKTAWTAHVKDEQLKEDITSSFKSSTVIRRRLKEMLKRKSDSAVDLTKDGYECSSWALKQADAIGYQRALKEIVSLLE